MNGAPPQIPDSGPSLADERAVPGEKADLDAERLSMLALLALAALAVGLRLFTMHEPVERDLAIHALIANEWLHGRELYGDLWNHKPPASFFVHALFIRFFGMGEVQLLALNICFGLWSLGALYFVARQMLHNRWAMLTACLWGIVLGFCLPLQANQPNTESLVRPMLLTALGLWLGVERRRIPQPGMFIAALLFFLTTLFKQHYAVIPATLGAFLLLADWREQGRVTRRTLGQIAIIGLTGLLGWAAYAQFLNSENLWAKFYEAAFTYNRIYAKGLGSTLIEALNLARPFLLDLLPLLLFSAAGLLWRMARAPERRLFWLSGWMLGCFLAMAIPGQFFPHYYQLLIAPAIVSSLFLLENLYQTPLSRHRRIVTWAIAVLSLTMVLRLVWMLSMPSLMLPILKYGHSEGMRFIAAQQFGKMLAARIPDGAPVFYVGSDPQVVFYAGGRIAPSKFYARWLDPAQSGKFAPVFLAETRQQFLAGNFDLVMTTGSPAFFSDPLVAQRLGRDFIQLPRCIHTQRLWVRRTATEAAIQALIHRPWSGCDPSYESFRKWRAYPWRP
ncbi:ArnT family glycosyltransferase [Niveibacterium terrae]|uniref:ArnT family glycosyltransferase n=1 Tax=Niveibacterium terrae TaxID=3373598 RepID=UPI003A9216A8